MRAEHTLDAIRLLAAVSSSALSIHEGVQRTHRCHAVRRPAQPHRDVPCYGTTGKPGAWLGGRCGYTDTPNWFPMRVLVAARLNSPS